MSKTTKAELRERLVNAAARNRRLVAANERCVRSEQAAHEALRQAKAERDEALAVAPAMAQLAIELVAAVRRAEAAERAATGSDAEAHAARWQRRTEEAGRERDAALDTLTRWQRRAEEAEAQHNRATERLSRAVDLLRSVALVDGHGLAGTFWWGRRSNLLRELS